MMDNESSDGALNLNDERDTSVAKDVEPADIPSCCVNTIRQHVQFNPMMVCAECKNIIKCFQEERAFQNYLKFCQSRRRPVLTGQIDAYWTIVFRSYDNFGR